MKGNRNREVAGAGGAARVWGVAAGRGSTKDAAPGAFTWQEYPGRSAVPREDWRAIIIIEAVRP